MDERLTALASTRGGVVTAGQCIDAGITRSCVRWALTTGLLVPLACGAWCPAATWEGADALERHRLKVRAGQAIRPRTVACAESAAVVLGLPLRDDPPDRARLTLARVGGPRGGDGHKGEACGRIAWLAPDEVLVLPDGLRVTTPARTVVDLARHTTFPWALAAADAAMLLHGSSAEELRDAAARNPRAPGHRAAALAARHADARAESALESVARGVMIQLGLPTPSLQVTLGPAWLRYRVDLHVRAYWTVVEADGKKKYRDDDRRAAERVWNDKRRRDDLHDWGHEVVRFVYSDQYAQILWGRRCVRSFNRAHERRGLPTPDWTSLTWWS